MEHSSTNSVLCIDDHPLYRKGISDLIDMDDSLELVGEAANGEIGLQLIKHLEPDIVLLDIDMRGMSGQQTLKAIKELDVDTRVVMLTVSDSEDDIVTAIRSGADGYLLKDMEPEDMLVEIHNSLEGKIAISHSLTQLLALALRTDHKVSNNIESSGITEREKEIIKHITKGESNKVIAADLNITESTVKVHVKNILKKLNLRSRVEVAVWALKTTDMDQPDD